MEKSTEEEVQKNPLDVVFHYLAILKRYFIFIVLVTAVPSGIAFVFFAASVVLPPENSPMPNTYEASAMLLVRREGREDLSGSIFTALGIPGAQSSSGDSGDLMMEILASRTFQDRLIDEFNIMGHIPSMSREKKRLVVRSRGRVTYTRATGVFRFSYVDSDPVLAKDIVNRVVFLLEEWFETNRGQARKRQMELLGTKIAEVQADMEEYQNQLKALQKQYGVLDVRELGASQATSIAALRSQLILKEIDIKNYSNFSKGDDPRLRQMQEERQNLIEMIANTQLTMPEMSKAPGSLKSLPDVAQQFQQLSLQIEIQQRVFNNLSPQYEAAKLAPESEPAFTVFELAEVPEEKLGPNRPKMLLTIFGGSLVASIVLALALDYVKGLWMQVKRRDPFSV